MMRTSILLLLCMFVATTSAFFHRRSRRGGCGGGRRFGGGFRFGGGGFRHGGGIALPRLPLFRRPGGCGGRRPPPPPPPPMSCFDGFIRLTAGHVGVNKACMKVKCQGGKFQTLGSACQPNSHCSSGRCMCNLGFTVEKTGFGGKVEFCKPKTCTYRGKPMKEGEERLNPCCSHVLKCIAGNVASERISSGTGKCSANSKCVDSTCICDDGFEINGYVYGDLVPICQAIPPVEKCTNIFDNGKPMKEGEYALSGDCNQILMCSNNKATQFEYGCPIYSSCNGKGKCTCDEGMILQGEELGGIVQKCHCPCEDKH